MLYRSSRTIAVLGMLLLLSASVAFAAASAAYVSSQGSDASGTGSSSAPYKTVATALAKAGAGGTVILEPGTYRTSVSVTRTVTLESDPAKAGAAAATIIDASGEENGITVTGPAAAGTVVDGLTVEHALKAGILAMKTSGLTIENDIVTDNDQSCAGYKGCFNPHASPPAPQGTFTYTNDVPCGSPAFSKHPGQDCEALHLVGVSQSKVLSNVVQANLDGGIYLTDEAGPTHGILVEGNVVMNNQTDCGITLASHNPQAVKHSDAGGVYDNTVTHNTTIGNGAAGVVLAGPIPGIAVDHNVIASNVIEDNGQPGIVVHTHAKGQNLDDNAFTDNFLAGNGAVMGDPDAGLTPQQSTGIDVFSATSKVTGLQVKGNAVSDQVYGIWLSSRVQQPVVVGNHAVGSVGTLVKSVGGGS